MRGYLVALIKERSFVLLCSSFDIFRIFGTDASPCDSVNISTEGVN